MLTLVPTPVIRTSTRTGLRGEQLPFDGPLRVCRLVEDSTRCQAETRNWTLWMWTASSSVCGDILMPCSTPTVRERVAHFAGGCVLVGHGAGRADGPCRTK
jgi:hypothetical protein